MINVFKNDGAPVFACLLDFRKAFDLVNHVKMFQVLLKRKISPIFICPMIVVYLLQKCYIKWRDSRSYSFSVTNGTRQGSMFSPKGGFGSYIDPLLEELKQSGHGCRIGNHWYGSLALADDILLLATSVQSLQQMITICEKFADKNDLVFSTDPDKAKSKTVCMAFNYKQWKDLMELKLNGDNVPWVEKKKYLGMKLHCNGKTEQDTKEKRGIFVSDCMALNQQYLFATPEAKLKMFKIYLVHFSGSNTWDFSSDIFQQLCNSFNVNVRVMFDIPRAAQCWLVERLANGKHAKQMIFSRFLKFVNGLLNNRRSMGRIHK